MLNIIWRSSWDSWLWDIQYIATFYVYDRKCLVNVWHCWSYDTWEIFCMIEGLYFRNVSFKHWLKGRKLYTLLSHPFFQYYAGMNVNSAQLCLKCRSGLCKTRMSWDQENITSATAQLLHTILKPRYRVVPNFWGFEASWSRPIMSECFCHM